MESTAGQVMTLDSALPAQAALLPGARVYSDGDVSPIVADRIAMTYRLYAKNKVKRILISGDHGQKHYDEVNTIRQKLLDLGIPAQDLFMDHAGFNTYDSIYRARDIFQVRSLIIVTQKFHLNRALYLANVMGVPAQGVVADRRRYRSHRYNEFREFFARPANLIRSRLLKQKPRFLGAVIPISGDGRQTED